MRCVVCGRGSSAHLRIKLTRLPSKKTAVLCAECEVDGFRLIEAERRVAGGAA